MISNGPHCLCERPRKPPVSDLPTSQSHPPDVPQRTRLLRSTPSSIAPENRAGRYPSRASFRFAEHPIFREDTVVSDTADSTPSPSLSSASEVSIRPSQGSPTPPIAAVHTVFHRPLGPGCPPSSRASFWSGERPISRVVKASRAIVCLPLRPAPACSFGPPDVVVRTALWVE